MTDTKNTIIMRLAAVRSLMADRRIDALVVMSADPHLSEYLPKHWQGREYLSGFTGSAGTLMLTQDFAGLWTDSRYWIQADMELQDTGITLQRQGVDNYLNETLLQMLPDGATVAIDGMSMAVSYAQKIQQTLAEKHITVVWHDLLDEVWQDRPPLPKANIVVHDPCFVDTTVAQKLSQIRSQMTQKGAQVHLISSLDDIAWLTNLRGADVAFNPVFLAHMLIWQDKATLFVDKQKLTPNAQAQLDAAAIDVQPYHAIMQALIALTGTVLFDPQKVAIDIYNAIPASCTFIGATNPSTLLKAIKSDSDIAHIRHAMRQDGVALCEFFAEFEERLHQGDVLDETDVERMLNAARERQPYYVSPSFDTIAGFGAHGAIVHYRASATHSATLQGDGLLLIDSGAQYQNGTTDITRMVGIGRILDTQKRDVTYVLKAHIALAKAVFVKGLSAGQLDVLARVKLWEQGLDYGHGTGHGVGYFLNVHEGPQSISYHAAPSAEKVMNVGMVTSNEPGLYRTGEYGIRLENLMVCVQDKCSEFGEFLAFETLTLCPFDTRLLDVSLLDEDEKTWLNEYHAKVRQALLPQVSGKAKQWLIERTKAV